MLPQDGQNLHENPDGAYLILQAYKSIFTTETNHSVFNVFIFNLLSEILLNNFLVYLI